METLMNLTVGQIFGGITGLVVILSIFVEITPIKINPISSFLAWVGKKTNTELTDRVEALDKKVSKLETKVTNLEDSNDERNAVLCRVRILRFGDEIRRGQTHSQDSWDQVFSDMDDYEAYCQSHPLFKNNKTVVTQGKIREEYSRCVDENDFL